MHIHLALGVALLFAGLATATAADLPSVATGFAESRPIIDELTVTGTVVAPRASSVSTEVAGAISDVHVEIGDFVEQGEPLVSLDDELAKIEHDVLAAAVDEAKAALQEAERRVAEAKRLMRERNIPETEMAARQSEADVAQATLTRRRAEFARQGAVLKRHSLKAPFAGVITDRAGDVGEWLTPGTSVVEMLGTRSLRIDFQVPQQAFPKLRQDTELTISLDALPGRELPARIINIVPRSTTSSRNFLLLAEPLEEDVPMIAGMSARGRLRLSAGVTGIVVPRDAVLRHPDGRSTVWTVSRDGESASVMEKRVTTGRKFAGLVEITTGLEAGLEVVVRGNEALRDSQRVVVVNPG